jgi:serine/threonine protein phosphatase PrpC
MGDMRLNNKATALCADFDVCAATITEAGKSRGGDCFCICEIVHENTLISAISDGVSSSPCDWLASETACRTAVETFVHGEGEMSERLKKSVNLAHNAVQQVGGMCAGSLATLILVAWQRDEDRVLFVSIGDSRLYKDTAGEIVQISRDDKDSVLITRDGKPMMVGGQPKFMFGLTSAIGQKEPLNFKIEELNFRAGDSLLLATDGAHGEGRFVGKAKEMLGYESLDTKLVALILHLSSEYEDDATLVVLRRNDCTGEAQELMKQAVAERRNCRELGVGAHLAIGLVETEVKGLLQRGEYDLIEGWLCYTEDFGLHLPRELLLELLILASASVPRHVPSIMHLRRLASKS